MISKDSDRLGGSPRPRRALAFGRHPQRASHSDRCWNRMGKKHPARSTRPRAGL